MQNYVTKLFFLTTIKITITLIYQHTRTVIYLHTHFGKACALISFTYVFISSQGHREQDQAPVKKYFGAQPIQMRWAEAAAGTAAQFEPRGWCTGAGEARTQATRQDSHSPPPRSAASHG